MRTERLPQRSSSMSAISVVVPAFNTALYLPDCLDSILGQTLRDLEVVCVDDGSTDATADILRRYAERDSRLRFVSQPNKGLSASRNRAIGLCAGKYLLFCDSDDRLKPDALLRLLEKAESDALDVLFYSGETFFEDESIRDTHGAYATMYAGTHDFSASRSGPELFAKMVEAGEYRSSACMQLIRRESLLESGVRFFDGILHEDNLFTFCCLLSAKRAARVNDPWYQRRMRADSIMTAPKRFANAYGYAVCAREMLRFVLDHPETTAPVGDACAITIKAMIRACRRILDSLPKEEEGRLATLPPVERLWMETIQCSRPERQFLGVKRKMEAQANEAERQRRRARSLARELSAVRRSMTFRVGAVLLAVPKALLRLFR